MFNSKARKEAQAELQSAVNKQKQTAEQLQDGMENLYNAREALRMKLATALDFINELKNTPDNIDITVKRIEVNLSNYQSLLDVASAEYKKANVAAGGTAAAGVAAGVGVAALAPTAAMAVATTFGTAATGTAISALSGAAATNAALAWLGGGALAAGGAGMAGGEALLALAGPLGWAIGGAAVVGGGLLASGKNKKAAEEMYSQASQVNAAERAQAGIKFEVKRMMTITYSDKSDIDVRLQHVETYPKDFHEMNSNQISMMGAFVNSVHTGAKHLNMVLGEDSRFVSLDE